ncbi:MAG: cytochrome P460 family protein [Mariprofundaceae bacterium]
MSFKRFATTMALGGIAFGLATGISLAGGKGRVTLAKDHRSWDHVRSTVIHDKENPLFGFLSVYANKKALKANKTGKAYPNGSKIVGIFHDVIDEGGIMTQGKRLKYVVMTKNKRHFKDTGGWGFQAFDAETGKKALIDDPKTSCFACHTAVEDRDFVFSTFTE